MIDEREKTITCDRCSSRLAELDTRRAEEVYEVGNRAKPGMGHQYYFDSTGRIALCAAKRTQ